MVGCFTTASHHSWIQVFCSTNPRRPGYDMSVLNFLQSYAPSSEVQVSTFKIIGKSNSFANQILLDTWPVSLELLAISKPSKFGRTERISCA